MNANAKRSKQDPGCAHVVINLPAPEARELYIVLHERDVDGFWWADRQPDSRRNLMSKFVVELGKAIAEAGKIERGIEK